MLESDLTFTDDYGLYDPQFEHDSCGVGLIADICGRKSHQIVKDCLSILCRMEHRGAGGLAPRPRRDERHAVPPLGPQAVRA